MFVAITSDRINVEELVERTRNAEAGAIVTFQGTVRRLSGDIEVESLIYESYREMAEKVIREIVDEAMGRFAVTDINVIHRVGKVELKEDSVAICVASPHRKDGFMACQYVIDEIKTRAPVWKKDVQPQGQQAWRD